MVESLAKQTVTLTGPINHSHSHSPSSPLYKFLLFWDPNQIPFHSVQFPALRSNTGIQSHFPCNIKHSDPPNPKHRAEQWILFLLLCQEGYPTIQIPSKTSLPSSTTLTPSNPPPIPPPGLAGGPLLLQISLP